MGLPKAVSCARIGGGKAGKALGENAARTLGRRAEKTANRDVDPNGSTKAREVAKLARIPTMDARSFRVTEGAKGIRRGGCKRNGQGVVVKLARVEAALKGSAKEFEWTQVKAPRTYIQLAKVSQVMQLLRWAFIESAGEPRN